MRWSERHDDDNLKSLLRGEDGGRLGSALAELQEKAPEAPGRAARARSRCSPPRSPPRRRPAAPRLRALPPFVRPCRRARRRGARWSRSPSRRSRRVTGGGGALDVGRRGRRSRRGRRQPERGRQPPAHARQAPVAPSPHAHAATSRPSAAAARPRAPPGRRRRQGPRARRPRRFPRRTARRTTRPASSSTSRTTTSSPRPCRARSARRGSSAATSPTSTTARAAARTAQAALAVRIPVNRVQSAVARFSELGTILEQQTEIVDLQGRIDRITRDIQARRDRIAKLEAELKDPTLSEAERNRLEARLVRAKRGLANATRNRAGVLRQSRFAKLDLAFTTEKRSEPAAPPSELRKTLDDALGVLAAELGVLLYLLIAGAPFFALALLAFLGARALRRGADARVLERA